MRPHTNKGRRWKLTKYGSNSSWPILAQWDFQGNGHRGKKNFPPKKGVLADLNDDFSMNMGYEWLHTLACKLLLIYTLGKLIPRRQDYGTDFAYGIGGIREPKKEPFSMEVRFRHLQPSTLARRLTPGQTSSESGLSFLEVVGSVTGSEGALEENPTSGGSEEATPQEKPQVDAFTSPDETIEESAEQHFSLPEEETPASKTDSLGIQIDLTG